MTTGKVSFYLAGGTLPYHAESYVERRADRELLQSLRAGDFCYVLTSRQMGKSSLMVRTAQKLRDDGVRVVILDLAAVGQNVTPEQWYNGLLLVASRQLGVEPAAEEFWDGHQGLSPVQRWFTALHDVALAADQAPLAIFVDEVDLVRSLAFRTDEFFAAVRECYNRRPHEPAFGRLTFCLMGVATPSELIEDPHQTPFNIGRRIGLDDFVPAEASGLAAGLGRGGRAQEMLDRVLFWTNGHPYLTQQLCRQVAEQSAGRGSTLSPAACSRLIDDCCRELFLSPRMRDQDVNLLFVRDRVVRTEGDLFGRLRIYDQVWRGQRVSDDPGNPLIQQLRLSGITRVEEGALVVRNRIYREVFDRSWVVVNLPERPPASPQAVAVLPFANLTGSEDLEYLCDGLTDGVIMALGQVRGLRVASRTSVFEFKGRFEDIRRIGLQLGVTMLLEGSVTKHRDSVRISAQLVRSADGCGVWSENFTYRSEDLLTCQDDLARAVSHRLDAYTGSALASAIRHPPKNVEAYDAYLRGIFHWNKRTRASLERSIEFFQRAIELDPGSGSAYAGLAYAHTMLATYRHVPPVDAYPKAKEAADRALALEPELPQAHTALGCILAVYFWDWAKAEEAFRKAISLNPSYAIAHQWYGINCLTPQRRHGEALAELEQAREVDPLSISVISSLGLALHYAGRPERAVQHCRETIELYPSFYLTHLFLGWACQEQGAYDDAAAAFDKAIELSQGDPVTTAALAGLHAARGEPDEARRMLGELLETQATRYVPGTEIALVLTALGELDEAVDWMGRALDQHEFRLIYVLTDPRVEPLRDHPGFQRILERLGLG